jgi:DNA-binding NtrC family response regulator
VSRSQNYLKSVSASQAGNFSGGRGAFQETVDSLYRHAAALSDELENLRWIGLPVESLSDESGIDFYQEVRRFEIFMITKALKRTDGSQTRAAVFLRMNLTTLNTKIKAYQIDWRRPEIEQESNDGIEN